MKLFIASGLNCLIIRIVFGVNQVMAWLGNRGITEEETLWNKIFFFDKVKLKYKTKKDKNVTYKWWKGDLHNLPSFLIPIFKHFFSRQCWHWFLWCWSTLQFLLPRHWYVKLRLTERLKKLLQPKIISLKTKEYENLDEKLLNSISHYLKFS